ncbi:hypothetical protein MSKU15_2514 [Komagataeibacter diospyri]|uniref:hypothetical protein n=1 Tax=Komagataeibacter diospyri TaxID=1932662 RepID=UPI00113948A7|nr:hypothetical protein [Komagataeibacter diospyri]GCE90913.1 hypothetical protein MSKU15_2514 [Komagataeibacter diospyri]
MSSYQMSETLRSLLKRVKDHKPSQEEIRERRVSFVMGSISDNSEESRKKIIDAINRMDGTVKK